MKDKNLDIELIERFQEGKLTGNERQVFHQRLLEDEEFAKAVQLHLNITEEIDTFWTNDMISKIEDWEKVEKRRTSIVPTTNSMSAISETKVMEESIVSEKVDSVPVVKEEKNRNWIKYVIGFIFLLVVAGLAWYFLQPKEEVDLFATNFESYEDVIENHSIEDSDLLTLAMGAYGEEDYSVSMTLLKRFLNEVDSISPKNRTAAEFYLAVSNLGTGNANTAKHQFETIAADDNNPFQKQADWYFVLANLRIDNLIQAKIQLAKIQAKPNHPYNKQADKLLKSLE